MISRNLFTDVLLIIMLVTLQIFLFNRMTLLVNIPCHLHYFVCFILFMESLYFPIGLSFFRIIYRRIFRTWGINAFATIIAYFRTIIFKTSQISSDVFSFHNLQWFITSFYFIFFQVF